MRHPNYHLIVHQPRMYAQHLTADVHLDDVHVDITAYHLNTLNVPFVPKYLFTLDVCCLFYD